MGIRSESAGKATAFSYMASALQPQQAVLLILHRDSAMQRRETDTASPGSSHVKVQIVNTQEDDRAYLRPNRYFRFFLFKEKEGSRTCWLPDGYSS